MCRWSTVVSVLLFCSSKLIRTGRCKTELIKIGRNFRKLHLYAADLQSTLFFPYCLWILGQVLWCRSSRYLDHITIDCRIINMILQLQKKPIRWFVCRRKSSRHSSWIFSTGQLFCCCCFTLILHLFMNSWSDLIMHMQIHLSMRSRLTKKCPENLWLQNYHMSPRVESIE